MDWQKTVGRKADVQKSIQFSCLGGGGFGVFFGIPDLKHQLYHYDGRTTSIYFSAKEHAEFMRRVGERFKDKEFVDSFERRVTEVCSEVVSEARRLADSLGQNPSPQELLRAFEEYDTLWNKWYPTGWAFFFIGPLEEIVKRALAGRPDADKCLKIIAFPDRLTPTMESEMGTLELAKIIGTPSAEGKARELAERFGWMSVYNTEDAQRTPRFYLEQAKIALGAEPGVEKRLVEIRDAREKNAEDFARLIATIGDPLSRSQIKLMHAAGYLRDMREEVRDKMTILERPLYETIARRAGLALSHVMFMTNAEIKGLLEGDNEAAALRAISEKRRREYCFTVTTNGFIMLAGEAEIREATREILAEQHGGEVRGQPAAIYDRKIVGPARIVFSNSELHKVAKGDVLIATMTKPDFVPAMKRAAAFVTDEGGITCHAAIVSRELGIPCVVGTKSATKVFKDGDVVEVDAVKGVVRKVS